MIITKLMGGLGNQMFQYALGRHLSIKHQTDLKFDVSYYTFHKKRKYELSIFNIKENFATEEEIKKLSGRRPEQAEERFSFWSRPKSYIKEQKIKFYPHILNLPNDIYLEGYWQIEKYFKDIKNIIQKDFEIKRPISGMNQELLNTIVSVESVNIHFRRGDYVSEETTFKHHGLCPLDYYWRSLKQLTEHVKNPQLFIFSDDMNWVRQNFQLDLPTTYIDHNLDNSFEDLRLMTQCKYHIISNSSFSWWAAWLSPWRNKIVFAPQNWYQKRKDYYWDDILPQEWIKQS